MVLKFRPIGFTSHGIAHRMSDMRVDLLRLKGGMEWQIRCMTQPFPAGGLGGTVSPLAGPGAESRKQMHFCNNLLKFGWIAVYTPNSGAQNVLKIEDGEIEGT